MDKVELANRIFHHTNYFDLGKFYDLYYNDMDDEIKEFFYDMNTILFNKEILNRDNYLQGYIDGGDVDKFLISEINFKRNKLRKNYIKMVKDQKIKDLVTEYNNNERKKRNE